MAESICAVSPVYNGAEVLPAFVAELESVLKQASRSYSILLIDDGSTDSSWDIISSLALKDRHIKGLRLSRNFGLNQAFAAGLHHADGDFVITLDSDTQDNPAYIPEMIAEARAGAFMVRTRRVRPRDSWLKNLVIQLIVSIGSEGTYNRGTSHFRLMRRRFVEEYKALYANVPLLEIQASHLGFPETTIDVQRRPRTAGKSGFNPRKLVRELLQLFIAYSSLPFAVMSATGALMIVAGALCLGFLPISVSPVNNELLLTTLLLASGIIIGSVGLLGFYVKLAQAQARRWPIYIVQAKTRAKK